MQNGHLLALTKENAKRVFSNKDDASLAVVVDELLADEAIKQAGHQMDCGAGWQQAHDLLAAIGGDDPLEQVLLGGRQLYQGQDRRVVLVRPDLVRHLADAMSQLDDSLISESQELIAQIRAFYTTAAQDGCAVLFCAN